MKRLITCFLLIQVIFFGSLASPIFAVEVTKELPDPSVYQFEDFQLTGLNLFNGKSYVDNSWLKVRLAIPKQTINCGAISEQENEMFGNCYLSFWASAESSVSLDPESSFLNVDYDVVLEKVDSDPSIFDGFAYIEKMKPIGTGWRLFTIRFFKKASGQILLKLGVKARIYPEKVLKKAIPIQLSVKTQAQVDAEKAAAAEKVAQEKAAREKAEAEQALIDAQTAVAEREAEEARAKEEAAEWRNKKLSITCVKGKITKKISGDPPVCPAGYTNPKAIYLTFQAFSKCKLYKQDAAVGGAQIEDAGRTLVMHMVPNVEFLINGLTYDHFNCAKKILKVPGFVSSKIGSTRAIDGIQSAKWGKLTAFWNYHPDRGLHITFTTK